MSVTIHSRQTNEHTRYLVFYADQAEVYLHGVTAMLQAFDSDQDGDIGRICVVTPKGLVEEVHVLVGGPEGEDLDYWEITPVSDGEKWVQTVSFKPGTWDIEYTAVFVDGWDKLVPDFD